MRQKLEVRAVRLEIAGEVLESVFDECDRYDRDETGGRIVGHFALDGENLVIQARGVIEPGPRARRTSTSFFQDGEYQAEVFRRIEAIDPSIEHLGNWHSHHVNGYPTLSSGDVTTYRRIVNHELHNLDFFYALLVTRRKAGRSGLERYAVRHYVLFRGDDAVREIAQADMIVTDQPKVWPTEHRDSDEEPKKDQVQEDDAPGFIAVRARDQVVLEVLCPSLEPRLSTRTGTFFWKGQLSLIDGSAIDVRVAEFEDDSRLLYYPVVSPSTEQVAALCETPFCSAALAIRALELQINREIYDSATKQ